MFKLWAFLTGQKIVYLKDYDGEVTKTLAKNTPYGYVAKRYWPFNVSNVILLDDGKVAGDCYVEEWRES